MTDKTKKYGNTSPAKVEEVVTAGEMVGLTLSTSHGGSLHIFKLTREDAVKLANGILESVSE